MVRQQAPDHPVFAGPRDEDLYKCVHCGLCLNACPTYLETGLETESPRGRIALMKAVREDRVSYTKQVTSHMDLCLQCRACEVVCPSGVPFRQADGGDTGRDIPAKESAACGRDLL